MLKCHSENLSQTACLKDLPPPLTLCLIILIFFFTPLYGTILHFIFVNLLIAYFSPLSIM